MQTTSLTRGIRPPHIYLATFPCVKAQRGHQGTENLVEGELDPTPSTKGNKNDNNFERYHQLLLWKSECKRKYF